MRVNELFHKIFRNASSSMDKRINNSLLLSVNAALSGAHLSTTSLGRHLEGEAKTKNKIKRVYRLFSNAILQKSFTRFYQDMAHVLLSKVKRPIILVDGSLFSTCGEFQFLSAATPVGGRSLPLLEQAFHRSEIMNSKVHKAFLEKLHALLPKGVKPIVITDAGFKTPWFRNVKVLGWDYIGRATNNVHYFDEEIRQWQPLEEIGKKAKQKPEFVMTTQVSKANTLTQSIYRFKSRSKGRKAMTLKGHKRRAAAYKKCAKRAKNPWILLTSLSPEEYNPKDIVNFYRTRMQIEESFRDLKDDYHGLGLVYNGSRDIMKITIALLIGAIVRFLLWALGRAVRDLKYHLSYQANTIRKRNVLSLFYIARQFLRNYKSYHKMDRPWRLVKINNLSLEFMYV